MDFEVKHSDLGGRICRLRTDRGTLETPALLPVVHPTGQKLPASEIGEMGYGAVMTNAYLALKYAKEEAEKRGIHSLIGFDGIVMTDSGGYQVLEYGDIEVNVEGVTLFQEAIGSDIATVLDKPTGLHVSEEFAKKTVKETLRASEETLRLRRRSDVLWMGPVQGGKYLHLLKTSAKKMSRLGFDIYALGSPTEVMEGYDFALLARMIYTAKSHLPLGSPIHLFGAGHPLTIPLAVALGCDMFDSASYVLYAKGGRYLTPYGTERVERLIDLPCVCPVCSENTVEDLTRKPEAEVLLARHNLHVLLQEVSAVKKAIRDGRLWEYLGVKARCHPKLWEAYRGLVKLDLLRDGTQLLKERAPFLFTLHDAGRPEIIEARDRLRANLNPEEGEVYLILPEQADRPFNRSPLYRVLVRKMGPLGDKVRVCFLVPGMGLIPAEVCDVYPFSQYLYSSEFNESPEVEKLTLKEAKKAASAKSLRGMLLVNVLPATSPLLKKLHRALPKNKLLTIEPNKSYSETAEAICVEVRRLLSVDEAVS